MISFVCWKWADPARVRVFLAEHVNVLRAMVARNYRAPHRFICVTDDGAGLDPRIEVVSPPPDVFPTAGARAGGRYRHEHLRGQLKRFPSCWRRLWTFSRDWAPQHLGERVFSLDIDVVITGSLEPLVGRTADFVAWCDPEAFGTPRKIAGGTFLLRTGSHPEVFEKFNPQTSPSEVHRLGYGGSDQAWLTHMLWPPRDRWTGRDGLCKLNWLPRRATSPPLGTRMVFTSGHSPPWLLSVRNNYPWISRYWTP